MKFMFFFLLLLLSYGHAQDFQLYQFANDATSFCGVTINLDNHPTHLDAVFSTLVAAQNYKKWYELKCPDGSIENHVNQVYLYQPDSSYYIFFAVDSAFTRRTLLTDNSANAELADENPFIYTPIDSPIKSTSAELNWRYTDFELSLRYLPPVWEGCMDFTILSTLIGRIFNIYTQDMRSDNEYFFYGYPLYMESQQSKYRYCFNWSFSQTIHIAFLPEYEKFHEITDVQFMIPDQSCSGDCLYYCDRPLKYHQNGSCVDVCDANFFYNDLTQTCEPCTSCAVGSYDSLPCSPTQDTVCSLCPYKNCTDGTSLICESDDGTVTSSCTFCNLGEYYDADMASCSSCTTFSDQCDATMCTFSQDGKCDQCLDTFYGTNCTESCDVVAPCLKSTCDFSGENVVCQNCDDSHVLDSGKCVTCDSGIQTAELCQTECSDFFYDEDAFKCIPSCSYKDNSYRVSGTYTCSNCTMCSDDVLSLNTCHSTHDQVCSNSSFAIFLNQSCDVEIKDQVLAYNQSMIVELEDLTHERFVCSPTSLCIPIQNEDPKRVVLCNITSFDSTQNLETLVLNAFEKNLYDISAMDHSISSIVGRNKSVTIESCDLPSVLDQGECVSCDSGIRTPSLCQSKCENNPFYDEDQLKCIPSCSSKSQSFHVPKTYTCRNCTTCDTNTIALNTCHEKSDQLCSDNSFAIFLNDTCNPSMSNNTNKTMYDSSMINALQGLSPIAFECEDASRCVSIEKNLAKSVVLCDLTSEPTEEAENIVMDIFNKKRHDLFDMGLSISSIAGRNSSNLVVIEESPESDLNNTIPEYSPIEESSGLNWGAIIGGAVAGLIVLILIVLFIAWGYLRYKRKVEELKSYQEPVPRHLEDFLNIQSDEQAKENGHEDYQIPVHMSMTKEGLLGEEYTEVNEYNTGLMLSRPGSLLSTTSPYPRGPGSFRSIQGAGSSTMNLNGAEEYQMPQPNGGPSSSQSHAVAPAPTILESPSTEYFLPLSPEVSGDKKNESHSGTTANVNADEYVIPQTLTESSQAGTNANGGEDPQTR